MIDLSVFMEPRGFIKVLQFVFVICAFACTCDFRGDIVLTGRCPGSSVTLPGSTAGLVTDPQTDITTTSPQAPGQMKEEDAYSVSEAPLFKGVPLTSSTGWVPTTTPEGELGVGEKDDTTEGELGVGEKDDTPEGELRVGEKDDTLERELRVGEKDDTLERELRVGEKDDPLEGELGVGEKDDDVTSVQPPVTEPFPEIIQFKTTFKYPFKLEKFAASGVNCNNTDVTMVIEGNYTTPASFYVFVGVSAFLYTLMAVALYTWFKQHYELEWVPVVDLAVHFAYSIMWFAGSIAWAVALTSIKHDAGLDSLVAANPTICQEEVTCTVDEIKWQLLDFSVVFGFLNFVLYLVNMWFIFKETTFYAKRTHPTVS